MNAAQAQAHNAQLAKEKKTLKSMFEFGLDAHAHTNGLTGETDSGLLTSMQTAAKSHSEYADRLMLDATKTPTAKKLMSAKHANNLLSGLAKQFNGIGDRIRSTVDGYERQIDSETAMNSTTRIMLGQGALTALGSDSTWGDVIQYLMAGDREVIRAMTLPQATVKYKLSNDPAKLEMIRSAAETVFLDEKELSGLRASREKLEHGGLLQGYFAKQYAANQGTIDSISASIVEA